MSMQHPKRADPPSHDRDTSTGTNAEAGSEATRGIHGKNSGGDRNRPGSEPLKERETEHQSTYGGQGGNPKSS